MMNSIVFSLGEMVHALLVLYTWVIVVSALLTWIHVDPRNPIISFIYQVSEPAYRWVRRMIPTQVGMVDMTPMLVLMLVQIVDVILVKFLERLVG